MKIWNTSATEAVCSRERSPCSTEKENNLAIKDQFDKESLQNILEKRFVPIVIQGAASFYEARVILVIQLRRTKKQGRVSKVFQG